jgi:hypothetical protein
MPANPLRMVGILWEVAGRERIRDAFRAIVGRPAAVPGERAIFSGAAGSSFPKGFLYP